MDREDGLRLSLSLSLSRPGLTILVRTTNRKWIFFLPVRVGETEGSRYIAGFSRESVNFLRFSGEYFAAETGRVGTRADADEGESAGRD